jgi:aspartate racemase
MSQQLHSPPIAYRTVGVLGGMGALATVDFLNKLVLATPAACDQEHIPLLVRFCPEVPDRADALLGCGPSPVSALVAAAVAIEQDGAQCLVIPCNTAHAWYDDIVKSITIPILHIVDAALIAARRDDSFETVGLLATTGTICSGIYQQRGGRDVCWITSSDDEQEKWVMPGIRAVKANRLDEAARLLQMAANALVHRGAKIIIMGCTEIPMAMNNCTVDVPLVDSTGALAQACVAWASAKAVSEEASVV